jgi:Adenosyl cobinamide kinase/adenosyl cobinamide phosphate guanylyltransferase
MSVTLVLGGARSGKSRYAESLMRPYAEVTYVAPGPVPDPSDPEWEERILRHQARRPAHWTTLETTDLAAVIRAADRPVLIDCLSTWLTHLIDDIDAWQDRERAASHLEKETARLLEALGSATVEIVLVSNEVGWSVVPGTESGRMFRDDLGRLNAAVSGASDHVALVVAGRVLDLSGCPVVAD